MICVLLSTVKLVGGLPANVTEVAPVKFVPVITTVCPPEVGPIEGVSEVMVGTA